MSELTAYVNFLKPSPNPVIGDPDEPFIDIDSAYIALNNVSESMMKTIIIISGDINGVLRLGLKLYKNLEINELVSSYTTIIIVEPDDQFEEPIKFDHVNLYINIKIELKPLNDVDNFNFNPIIEFLNECNIQTSMNELNIYEQIPLELGQYYRPRVIIKCNENSQCFMNSPWTMLVNRPAFGFDVFGDLNVQHPSLFRTVQTPFINISKTDTNNPCVVMTANTGDNNGIPNIYELYNNPLPTDIIPNVEIPNWITNITGKVVGVSSIAVGTGVIGLLTLSIIMSGGAAIPIIFIATAASSVVTVAGGITLVSINPNNNNNNINNNNLSVSDVISIDIDNLNYNYEINEKVISELYLTNTEALITNTNITNGKISSPNFVGDINKLYYDFNNNRGTKNHTGSLYHKPTIISNSYIHNEYDGTIFLVDASNVNKLSIVIPLNTTERYITYKRIDTTENKVYILYEGGIDGYGKCYKLSSNICNSHGDTKKLYTYLNLYIYNNKAYII